MRKITKKLLITMLAIILCFSSMPTFVEAAETEEITISPRFSTLGTCSFNFSASSSGGQALVDYEADSTNFARAEINIKLQKKFLLLFWTDVSEWNSSSTESYGDFYHVFDLNGSGTYKATFTFTVTASDGTVDTVTKEIESSY